MSIINIYFHDENIYNVEKKPAPKPPKPPLYHSKFQSQIRNEVMSCKENHRTMGYAEIPLQKPNEFLKKNCGVRYRATKSAPVRMCSMPKPPIPDKSEFKCDIQPKNIDFKKENIKSVVTCPAKKPKPRYADTRKGDFHDLEPSGLVPVYMCQQKFGKLPVYLCKRRREMEAQKQKVFEENMKDDSLCQYVEQQKRIDILRVLIFLN
jgi:hypothetical protein